MAALIDRETRARARAKMQALLACAEGRRLPRRTKEFRPATRVLRLILWIIALVVLSSGALVTALNLQGRIAINQFAPSLERDLSDRIGGGDAVKLGSLALSRDGLGIGVSFTDMTVRDASGRLVLEAPSGLVGVDALSLLSGNVQVRRLALDRLKVKLEVAAGGAVTVAGGESPDVRSVAIAAPKPPGEGAPTPATAVAIEKIVAASQMVRALDRIAVRDATIEIDNDPAGLKTVYDHLWLTLRRTGEAAQVELTAEGPSGPLAVSAEIGDGDAPSLDLTAKDLALADLAAWLPVHLPIRLDSPLSATFRASLTKETQIKSLAAHFSLGAGKVAIETPDLVTGVLDEASGDVEWDGLAKRYRIKNWRLLAGDTRFGLEGWTEPPIAPAREWSAHFETKDSVLAAGKPSEAPLPFFVVLDGHYDANTQALDVDRAALKGATVTGLLSAHSELGPDGRGVRLELSADGGDVVEAIRFWPRTINPEARDWCRDHILGGEIGGGSLKLDFDAATIEAVTHKRAAEADRLHAEVSARKVVIQPLPTAPAVMLPDLATTLTGRTLAVSGPRAEVELSPARTVHLIDVSYVVPDTTPALRVPSRAAIKMQASADALADLLSREAFKPFWNLSLDPAAVKGQFDGAVILDAPLGPNVAPDEIGVTAAGTLSNFSLDKAMGSQRFEQGNLTVQVDKAGLRATGTGQLLGASATLEVSRPAGEEGSLALSFALDAAARKKLGVPASAGVDGAIGVRVKAPLSRAGADVDLDLTKAALEAPLFGPVKPAGKPGRATFSVKSDEDGLSIANLLVDAGALSAKGSVKLDAQGGVRSARFATLRISGSEDLRVDAANDGSLWRVGVRGGQIDAKPLLHDLLGRAAALASPANASDPDLDLDVALAGAAGGNKMIATQVQLSASRRGGQMRRLALQARLGLGPVTLQRGEDGATSAHAADAGALLKFLDLYSRMEGGVFDLATQEEEGVEHGSVTMTAFTLHNEPALKQLAAAGQPPADSDAAAGANGATFDANAVAFEKLRAKFNRTATRIDLVEGEVFNPVIGLTSQGTIDFGRNQLDLNGTFIPAFQVNNLVGQIPIVGILLTGARNEGVFGVNYRLAGAFDASTLTINPLSAVTPGILRKIMGVIDGTGAPAPQASSESLSSTAQAKP